MEESRTARAPQRTQRLIRLGYVLLLSAALYCAWGLMSFVAGRGVPVLYWLVVSGPEAFYALLALAWTGVIAMAIARLRWNYPTIILITVATLVFIGTILAYCGVMSHLDSAAFEGRIYHLAANAGPQSTTYVLCACDASGIICNCRGVYADYTLDRKGPESLVVDEVAHELQVRLWGNVVYVDGPSPRCYETEGVCLEESGLRNLRNIARSFDTTAAWPILAVVGSLRRGT